ncbi:MAG: NHL repeat-containing protein [Planctomycetes bacterium]|nr:NHL repeat-containing protein [Planctomycetota bacterium]
MHHSFTLVVGSALCCLVAAPAHAGPVLYATSYYSNNAYAVNSDGSTTVFGATIGHASGIALDSAGNVYVGSETSNAIYKFTSTGTLIGTFTTDHLNAPTGMAFDSTGKLFVANGDSGEINEYSSSGAFLGTFATVPIGSNGLLHGLLIDPTGNVYVTDILSGGTGNLIKYNSAGTVLATTTTGLSYPGQIARDSLGNLYVSNAGGDHIVKFDSLLNSLGNFASGTGANNYGVAYDAATNTFYQGTFGPSGNPSGPIQRFDANGSSLGFVAADQTTAYFLAVARTEVPAPVPEPSTLIGSLVMCGMFGAALGYKRLQGQTAV